MITSKCLLIDFYDSFTFNIASGFYQQNIQCDIVKWDQLDLESLDCSNFDFLVLGPGPGHPNDYLKTHKLIYLLMDKKIPIIGICLGHQILCEFLGGEVRKTEPIHGQSVELKLPKWPEIYELSSHLENGSLVVQRYNSLLAFNCPGLSDDGMFLCDDNLLGLQFHPESIGTPNSYLLFEWLVKWAYNKGLYE